MNEASGRAPIVLCDVTQVGAGIVDGVSRALTSGLRSTNFFCELGVCKLTGGFRHRLKDA